MSEKPEETEKEAESEGDQEDSKEDSEDQTDTEPQAETEASKEEVTEEPKKEPVKEEPKKEPKKAKKTSKDAKEVKKESKEAKKEKPKTEDSKEKSEEPKEEPKEKPKTPIKVSAFKAKMKDSKIIKGIFEAVSSIINETRIQVKKDKGLFMSAMDGSHICLVSLSLKKEDFDTFEAQEDFELGLNLEDVTKILKRLGAKDEITFSVDTKNKRLIVEMKPENGKKARTFKIALMDIEAEEVNMETLVGMSFENIIEIDSDFLDEACKDGEIMSEAIQVKARGDAVVFSTEGSLGDMEYELNKDELIKATFTKDGGCTYAIQFLKSILKIAGIQKTFEVQFGNEQPLNIKAKILKNSEIIYFLAPRVDEDPNIGEDQ